MKAIAVQLLFWEDSISIEKEAINCFSFKLENKWVRTARMGWFTR